MSNRLKFYREQMAAFEGTVDPRSAIDSGYYIPEPRKSSSSQIARIALRPSAKHLLIGGIGSGKTTQLLIACDQLNDIENISAHYIDVSLYTDISKLSTNTLVVITGLLLLQLAKDHSDEKIKKYQELIQKEAYGYSEYINEKSPMEQNLDLLKLGLPHELLNRSTQRLVKHQGILTKERSNSIQNELKQAIHYLNSVVRANYGEIIILFDGLDRLDDASRFNDLIKNDVQNISLAGIGVVLIGPLLTLYSQYRDIIEPAVNHTTYQSCFDVENDRECHSFFKDILNIRSRKNFIDQSASLNLIKYSGGVLRDLINLTQASIEEAYISDEENLKEAHVEAAATSFGRAKILGVSDQDLAVLKQIANTGKFVPRTDEEIRLLVTGRVLEYQYPAKRFAVHPTLQPLL
jgi:hypothetical protein